MKKAVEMFRKSSILKFFIVGLPLMVLAATPLMASAQVHGYDIWAKPGYWGPILSCSGQYPLGQAAATPGVTYCTSLSDLLQTFVNAVYLLMSIGLFIIAPVLFIVGGIMMIVSSGNPEMIGRARKTMIGSVIGVVIVLCAYLIVNTVIAALGIAGVSGFGS